MYLSEGTAGIKFLFLQALSISKMLHLIITWVNSAVSSQIIWTIECLWTLGTLMRPLSCMSVDVLLETKWMAECLVAHGTFPFPATHIRAHSLNMSCKVAERSKYLATLSTSITLCEENNISLSLHILPPHKKQRCKFQFEMVDKDVFGMDLL